MKFENETRKRIYESVSVVIVKLQAEDLLTVSGGGDDFGINLPLDPL